MTENANELDDMLFVYRFNSLIAAAPELFQSLERLLEMFDSEIMSEYEGTSMLESRLAEADFAREILRKLRV